MAEITAATAVGWVVSPIVKMVIEKTKSFIEEKYFGESSIEDDMKKMNTTLLEILSTMVIVEKHRIVDPNQVLLVRQIKDAVYDAEDCMDDFDYELAKEVSEKLQKSKVRRVSASCSRVIHKAIDGYSNLKKKLRKVNKSLDQAKASAKTLLEQMNARIPGNMQHPEQENQFITSSVPSGEITFGREKERELIIEWMLEEKAGPPTIVPIVGQGGLGKTTLAQIIFNDHRLNSHFESNKKMWLTVSDNFDKVELTKQMLKYLCENFSTKDVNFDILQRKLQTELSSKKILLILDDVWYFKDENKKYSYERGWLEFLAPLRNAKAGSTIIVTTRDELVVNTLKSWDALNDYHEECIRPISLDALNDDDGWSLLKLKAFVGENPDNLNDLEPIGRKIVKKLEGLPLAIRVVGPRLRGKFDVEEWEKILTDDSLDNGIMEVLHRSYEHLPGHLQRCFAYCSLFPKDYYLKHDRLVHMWIAQGFVLPKMGKRLEDVGKSYFNELIARSFIQVIKRNNKEYHVMHDLMNDLACHVSKGECYIFKEGDTLENLDSVRHLSVTATEHAHLVNIHGLDKLRALILLYDSRNLYLELYLSDEAFIKMKRIRVLDIDCWWLDNLPNIGKCKHLHYLCFRHLYRNLAPDTFSKLHLLTVLFIRNMYKGEGRFRRRLKLPQSICSISRLEFIGTNKSIMVELDGQVQLHSIWRGGPADYYVQRKQGCKLDHLKYFNNIKGELQIGGLQNVVSREEAIEAQLGSKEHVTQLFLGWHQTSRVKGNKQYEILEALRPHRNIERLEIYNYPGDKFSSWLEPNWLSRITYIEIQGKHSGFKMLPALGQFSQLKIVKIRSITTVSRIGDEFYGNDIFPSLEELEISFMPGLEEWSSPSGIHSFPKLCRLIIESCLNLFSLPEMESFCSLESVQIIKCPKIRSLPKVPVSCNSLFISQVHPDLEEQLRNDRMRNDSSTEWGSSPEWDEVAAASDAVLFN